MSPKQSRWFLAGILITAGLVITARTCRAADLDVAATQAQVEEILGVHVDAVPTLQFVAELPWHDAGGYADGKITISREARETCWPLILAHEVSHHVAIKGGMLRTIPNDRLALQAELARIAHVVEVRFVPYSPNCFDEKG